MKLLKILIGVSLLSALGWVLYAFPPETSSFYPRCIFHQATGWECAGCGGLRAAHHLLHGHWGEAFRLNPFVTILGPVVAGLAGLRYLLRAAGYVTMNWIIRPLVWWLIGAAALAFAMGRNMWRPG